MATIDSLANETLIGIMEMLKAPPVARDQLKATSGRYDNLRAAALVCSRWRDPAQRALFDEVELSGLFLRRYTCFITSPAQLRYQTRSLCASEVAEWFDVLRVAEACDRLQSLTCKSLGSRMAWNDLARPCFAGEVFNVEALGGLRHITIWKTLLIGEPLEPSRSLPSLPSLSLWTVRDANTVAFLGDLSKSSKDSIKTLHFRITDAANNVALNAALSDVAQSIRALALEMPSALLERYNKIFPPFGALESFSWYPFHPRRSLNARDVAKLPSILDAFPSPATLTHLSIGSNDFTSLEHISTILSHPSLSLLAKLDFPYLPPFIPADVEQARRFISMAEACEQREIQWRLGRG